MTEILEMLLNLNNENISLIDDYHPYDIAIALEENDDMSLIIKIAELLNEEKFSEIFVHFSDEVLDKIALELGVHYVSLMLSFMEVDDAADILNKLSHPKKYLPFILKERKEEILKILSYDEDDVGSIMNTAFIKVDVEMNAKQATKSLMNIASKSEFINVVFVCEKDKYIGLIPLKKLITARANDLVKDIMITNIDSVLVDDDKEEAAKLLQNFDVEALPVVDENNNILGIITYDDVLDVAVDAATEDYAAFAGVLTDTIEHDNETVFGSFKKRIIWLLILLFANLLSSTILSNYEASFEAQLVAVLSIFLPLILGMAGNTGTQSLAITVRLLGKDELDKASSRFKLLLKEFIVGLINGLIISICMFGIVCLVMLITEKSFNSNYLVLALVTSISVLVIMIISTLAGVLVPLFMRLIHVDPAVASGPFITTINDVIALVTYFSLAGWLLSNIL